MNWAITKDTEINETMMTEQDVDEEGSDTTIKLNSFFYYILAGRVDGPAYTVVDQIEDANGLKFGGDYIKDMLELNYNRRL